MQDLPRQFVICGNAVALAVAVSLGATAHAQSAGTDEAVEEIIVVGTRRQDRTATDTPVPVDVFDEQLLESVSSHELLDVLQTLVPSLNVERWPRGDGNSFIRPPKLRGLDSDKTLVLVNGKRRHRGALVQLSGFGSHGPDLATIPAVSLRNVEVLRDGASAMYGSDAIAGVLNFNLRDSAEGAELFAEYGQFSTGDESSFSLSGNLGLPIGDRGFVNISAEWNDAEQTSRGVEFDRPIAQSGLTPAESALVSGFFDHDGDPNTPEQERFGPDAVTEVYSGGQLVSVFMGSDGIPDDTDTRFADNLGRAEISEYELVQLWGRPDRDAIHVVVNAGYELGDASELYGWATYSDSNTDRNAVHRRVGSQTLFQVRTADAEIYDPRSAYPAGFTPRFFGNVIDQSITAGIRGEWSNDFTYDFSGRYGSSELRYRMSNSINPSLGPESPTTFRPGNLVSDELGLAADFTMPIAADFADDMLFAFGVEYREEGYRSEAGDPASFATGPYAADDPWDFETSADEAASGENGGVIECRLPGLESVGTPCPADDPIHNVLSTGSESFPGYGPFSVFDYDRDSWSAYADIDADLSDRLTLTAAGRYEDFSDYGSNFSWRLAGRFGITDDVAIRASAGTGFRAPTPGQIATINVSGAAGILDNDPFLRGVFPSEHPAAQVFGAVPLDAETSRQWTLGLVATPFDTLRITLDYYHIEVDDRLFLSNGFDVGPAERAILIASGVPGANAIEEVFFLNNDIDTETDGIDIVVTYSLDWSAGNTDFSVAANWNDTEVTRRTPRPDGFFLSDAGVFAIENGLPEYRAVTDIHHSWGDGWSWLIRGNWYGSYRIMNNRPPFQVQAFDAVLQVDTELTKDFADGRVNITIGGRNLFDALPDPGEIGVCCGIVYRTDSVMDWQGPYYYLQGRVRW